MQSASFAAKHWESAMQSRQRATMSRWLMVGVLCVAAVAGCDDDDNGANTLSLSAGGFGNDSAVVHTRVTFPGFDHNFVDYAKFGPVTIPVLARSGTIRMQFARIKGQSDTIGRADLSLKITRGNGYSASFVRLPAGMQVGCFGCNGELKSPMIGSASASTDSMHLSYSNSPPLCKGCVAVRTERVRMVARRE